MTQHYGWLSLLPPVAAIVLALWLHRVIPALLAAILLGTALLAGQAAWQVPMAAVDHFVSTAAVPDNFRLILFSVLIGGLIALMRSGGAFDAFARVFQRGRPTVEKRTLFTMTFALGTALFLETWSNVLVSGTALGSLFDRLGIARQRMAYFMHTIAINAVALIPFNSWAAFYLGLLAAQQVERPFQFLLASLPFVLYCWISLGLVAIVMVSGWTIGPMRRFDLMSASSALAPTAPTVPNAIVSTAATGALPSSTTGSLTLFVTPLVTLIAVAVFGLTLTGGGDPRQGNGAAAVLYAVVAASVVAALDLRLLRKLRSAEIEKVFMEGCGSFAGAAALVLLALTLGQLIKELGTGLYVASLFEASVPRALYAPLVFLIGAVMSFATGTSYGTFSIMTPIALPLAYATGSDPHLLFGACLAGGVFGDNCSPISDTTIVTSIATQVTAIDHVTTQLPFALCAAAATTAGFGILGVLLS